MIDKLKHDLRSLSSKLEMLAGELTQEDLKEKSDIYSDLVSVLNEALELKEKIK